MSDPEKPRRPDLASSGKDTQGAISSNDTATQLTVLVVDDTFPFMEIRGRLLPQSSAADGPAIERVHPCDPQDGCTARADCERGSHRAFGAFGPVTEFDWSSPSSRISVIDDGGMIALRVENLSLQHPLYQPASRTACSCGAEDAPCADVASPVRVGVATQRRDLATRLLAQLAASPKFDAFVFGWNDHTNDFESDRPADVVLLDKATLHGRGNSAVPLARQAGVDRRVLLLLDEPDAETAIEIVTHRYCGYISTHCSSEVLLKAIASVLSGEIWLPRALLVTSLRRLAGDVLLAREPAGVVQERTCFTDRERQVLTLLKQGKTNKQIASDLGVMEDTVKKHLQHVYDKLGVRRRALVLLQAQGSVRIGEAGPAALAMPSTSVE